MRTHHLFNFSISAKLAAGFSTMVLLTFLMGIISLIATNVILSGNFHTLLNASEEKDLATDVQVALLEARRYQLNYFTAYLGGSDLEEADVQTVPFVQENIDHILEVTNYDWAGDEDTDDDADLEHEMMSSVQESVQALNESFTQLVSLTKQRGNISSGLVAQNRDDTNLVFDQLTVDHPETQLSVALVEYARNAYLLNQQQEYIDTYHQNIGNLRAMIRTLEASSSYKNNVLLTLNIDETNFAVVVAMDEVIQTKLAEYTRIEAAITSTLNAFVMSNDEESTEAIEDHTHILEFAKGLIIDFLVGTVVIGSILAYVISRSIARPLNQITRVAAEIANGDLEQQVDVSRHDEIGKLAKSFNEMTDVLAEMMFNEAAARQKLETTVDAYMVFVERVAQGDLTQRLDIPNRSDDDPLVILGTNLNRMVDSLSDMTARSRRISTQLSASATEILAATTQQLSSITEQDASVTQTMATVNEVRTTVTQTSHSAQAVADAAQQSMEVSERGLASVMASVEGMQMIRTRVEDIAHNILALSEQTQQIGEIIATVNDIAEQSKLLALNASIEAARAGEEGRGFAVVAMEVRALAEQSRIATEQIRIILNEIQQSTNTAVMATEEGSKGVDVGMEQVTAAGEVISELAGVIREAAQTASRIAVSTHQQSTGMDQLAAAMMIIQQSTLQGQSSTTQSEKSAQSVNKMAQQMQESIAHYRI